MESSNKNISFWLLFAFFIVLALAIFLMTSNVFSLKTASYDFMVKVNSDKQKPSSDIMLVIVDDKSLTEIGRWPWSRARFDEIFDYLNNYTDSKLIAFDALIAAKNVENPKDDSVLFENIGKYDKLTVGVAFSEKEFPFSKRDITKYNLLLDSKKGLTINDARTKKPNSIFNSFTQFPYQYFENAKNMGGVNIIKDSDGKVRQLQQVIDYKGILYPSMELILYSKYTGIKNFTLTNKYLTGSNKSYSLKIPITNMNEGISNNIFFYSSPDKVYSHTIISASDILKSYYAIKKGEEPTLDKEIFKDKVVFVGANASAQYAKDEVRSPVSDLFSGTELRATNFNNMLNNQYYVSTNNLYDFVIGIMLFIFIFMIVNVLPVPVALISTFTVTLLYMIFSGYMYSKNIATNMLLPVIFVPMALIMGYAYKLILEAQKNKQIEKTMSKYISKDVMENVMQNINSVGLGGKRSNISVLFADIRGFTTISEALSAEEVSLILNEYFSAIVPIIEKHRGVLNKFVGDAVLAIFGEPIQNKEHALDAVKCGWDMINKVKELQEKWIEEGKPKIEIGIGISTGEAFVGNIGSEDRFEYTVIGDTVNTASRIENFNKVYKTKFLISQSTFDAVQKHVDVLKIRDVAIRGKVKKVNLYEVLRLIN